MTNKKFLFVLIFVLSFFFNIVHFSVHTNKIYNIGTKEEYSVFYWSPYVKNLDRKIRNNWTPPKENKKERIVATVEIAKTLPLKKIKHQTTGTIYEKP